jgi:predicted Zn-dependent protease
VSRPLELEADWLGADAAAAAGLSLQGALDTFTENSTDTRHADSWLEMHPPDSQRADQIRKIMKKRGGSAGEMGTDKLREIQDRFPDTPFIDGMILSGRFDPSKNNPI